MTGARHEPSCALPTQGVVQHDTDKDRQAGPVVVQEGVKAGHGLAVAGLVVFPGETGGGHGQAEVEADTQLEARAGQQQAEQGQALQAGDKMDFTIQKAVELGARRILPVQTRHTNSERIRQDRLQAHAVEAAEQCGGTYVPEVADLAGLDRLLAGWPEGRRILWCDESLVGAAQGLAGAEPGPWAIWIG